MTTGLELAERGFLPDGVVRWGIRRLLSDRLREVAGDASSEARERAWIEAMREAPIATHTDDANAQHYELPPAFFEAVLGPHLKYSSGLWRPGTQTLAVAEADMLALTAERAGLRDGQRILELGCGWGSLSLWMAAHYPQSCILAVSNSEPQRHFIEARAAERGLTNLQVRTADINRLEIEGPFDRVVSVEMFEHMRNWEKLMERVAGWLDEDGRLFLHVFCHRERSYPFEPRSENDWMARYFFTGGMMPSHDLPSRLCVPFVTEDSWYVSGNNYAKTALAWLGKLDAKRSALEPLFIETYGRRDAQRWIERWRMFFLACAELFGWDDGREWHVSHQLLRRRPAGETH